MQRIVFLYFFLLFLKKRKTFFYKKLVFLFFRVLSILCKKKYLAVSCCWAPSPNRLVPLLLHSREKSSWRERPRLSTRIPWPACPRAPGGTRPLPRAGRGSRERIPTAYGKKTVLPCRKRNNSRKLCERYFTAKEKVRDIFHMSHFWPDHPVASWNKKCSLYLYITFPLIFKSS